MDKHVPVDVSRFEAVEHPRSRKEFFRVLAAAGMRRACVGATGEFRAGPVVPEFEALYAKLARRTSRARTVRASYRVDRFVYDRALALFLCAPRALYAVNKHVDFTPYRTSFELAETRVSGEHWSRR